jgi:hypothetical protein
MAQVQENLYAALQVVKYLTFWVHAPGLDVTSIVTLLQHPSMVIKGIKITVALVNERCTLFVYISPKFTGEVETLSSAIAAGLGRRFMHPPLSTPPSFSF